MRIRLLRRIQSDLPLFADEERCEAGPGECEAAFNQYGAVYVTTRNGDLGVKPDEYEVVSMTPEEMVQIQGQPMLAFAAAELKRLRAAEFWHKWVYPDGATAEQVQAELADYHQFMGYASKVYCELTGGRISKINTLPEVVISVAQEVQQKDIEEAIAEAREEWEAEKPTTLQDRIDQADGVIG